MPVHNSYLANSPLPDDYIKWIMSVILDQNIKIPGFRCILKDPGYQPHFTLALARYDESTLTDLGSIIDQQKPSILAQLTQEDHLFQHYGTQHNGYYPFHYHQRQPNIIDLINETLIKNMAEVTTKCLKISMLVEDFQILQPKQGKVVYLGLRLKNIDVSGNGDIRTLNTEILKAFNFKELKVAWFSEEDKFIPHITIGVVEDLEQTQQYLATNKELILNEINKMILEISSLELLHYTESKDSLSQGQNTILFNASLCRRNKLFSINKNAMQILENLILDCIETLKKKQPERKKFDLSLFVNLLQEEQRYKRILDIFPESTTAKIYGQEKDLYQLILQFLNTDYGKEKFHLGIMTLGDNTHVRLLLPKDSNSSMPNRDYQNDLVESVDLKKAQHKIISDILTSGILVELKNIQLAQQDLITLGIREKDLAEGLKILDTSEIAEALSAEINKLPLNAKIEMISHATSLFKGLATEKLQVRTGDFLRYMNHMIKNYPDTFGVFFKKIHGSTRQTAAFLYNPKGNGFNSMSCARSLSRNH